MLATVGFGLALGLVNGILIGVARISFFVVTLGTLSIYASIALLTTSGDTISLYDKESYSTSASLANGNVFGVPRALVLCGVLYAIGAAVLRYTRFGRAVYAVGSNPEAARLAGVKVVLSSFRSMRSQGFAPGPVRSSRRGASRRPRRRSTRR